MRASTVESQLRLRLRTLYYWCILLIALLVLDDLVFGWIFWLLAQLNLVATIVFAFVASWVAGYWLTLRGLDPNPGRIAKFLLQRLQLERKNEELARREVALRERLASTGAAVPMTLLFGGVVTTLWLRRRELVDARQARRLGFWLSGVYALEFSFLHAFAIGGGITLLY